MGKKQILNRFAPAYLLVFFLALTVAVYLAVRAMGAASSVTETTVAEAVTYDDAITAEGWFIRDETVAEGTSSHTVKHIVSNGEKVQADAALAVVYADASIMEASRRLEEIEQELSLLQAAVQTAGSYTDTAKTDQLIVKQMEQLAGQVEDGMPAGAASSAMTLRELTLRRGANGLDESTLRAQITLLEGEQSKLAGQAYGRSETISAPVSGYFSEVVDGYESVLRPETVLQMQPDAFEKLTEKKVTAPTGKLGKVMSGFTWYFAVILPEDDAGRLPVGKKVTLKFSQIASDSPATVVAVNRDEEAGRALVVFSSTTVDGDLVSVRQQEVSIVLATYEGLRVPVSAVTMRRTENADGTTTDEIGVYILTGATQRFKTIETVFKNSECYIVKKGNTKSAGLVAGDRIITRGTELSDLKVMK